MNEKKIFYETNFGKILLGDSYKELKSGSFET